MGAILHHVNLTDGNLVIEVGDDPGLRRAAVAKVLVEMLVTVATFALAVNMYKPDLIPDALDKAVGKVKRFLFGPPPPTEEEIKTMAKSVILEAKKIVRDNEPGR